MKRRLLEHINRENEQVVQRINSLERPDRGKVIPKERWVLEPSGSLERAAALVAKVAPSTGPRVPPVPCTEPARCASSVARTRWRRRACGPVGQGLAGGCVGFVGWLVTCGGPSRVGRGGSSQPGGGAGGGAGGAGARCFVSGDVRTLHFTPQVAAHEADHAVARINREMMKAERRRTLREKQQLRGLHKGSPLGPPPDVGALSASLQHARKHAAEARSKTAAEARRVAGTLDELAQVRRGRGGRGGAHCHAHCTRAPPCALHARTACAGGARGAGAARAPAEA